MKSSSSIRPLTTGTALSASTAALMKNDIRPSLIPFFFVNASCDLARNSCTALMSHSLNVVRMAAVCCAITSCAAILRRNGDIFLRINRSVSGCASRSSAAEGGKLTVSPTGFCSCTTVSASPFVRRPPFPVPEIFPASRCSSSRMRRTAGERGSSFAGGVFRSFSSTRLFSPSGSFFFSGGFSVFLSSGADFESSIVATTSPIFTSCPSAAFASRTPDFSATISVETLSVSRVKRASPASTKSPDFLCQIETTPLEIDSPTAGIFTSMLMNGLQYAQTKRVVEPNVLKLRCGVPPSTSLRVGSARALSFRRQTLRRSRTPARVCGR